MVKKQHPTELYRQRCICGLTFCSFCSSNGIYKLANLQSWTTELKYRTTPFLSPKKNIVGGQRKEERELECWTILLVGRALQAPLRHLWYDDPAEPHEMTCSNIIRGCSLEGMKCKGGGSCQYQPMTVVDVERWWSLPVQDCPQPVGQLRGHPPSPAASR